MSRRTSRTRGGLSLGGGAVLLVVVVGLCTVALAGRGGGNGAQMMDGHPAPTLSGTTLAGARYDLRPRDNTASVVTIWASWCPGCRDELPALRDGATRWARHGVRFVTIDTRDGAQAARDVLRETGAQSLTTVSDPQGRMAVTWGATGVPETIVVDRHGVIAGRWLGQLEPSWLDQRLRRLVAP